MTIEARKMEVETAKEDLIKVVWAEHLDGVDADISDAIVESKTACPGYATLQWDHFHALRAARQAIQNYFLDTTRRRPLNMVLQAAPGSGKSYLVKCLASSVGRGKVFTCNMSGSDVCEDLVAALELARNAKMDDFYPFLFIDEVDSQKANYRTLLPLLWDGEINLKGRTIRLGKSAIVLAVCCL